MKRIIILFLCLTLCFFSVISVGAEGQEKAYNWFIIKKKGERPSFPKEAEYVDISEGFYIDNSPSAIAEKRIYLTFDAGYENGNISKILDVMRDEKICGSFFILSNLILKNTELVKRMADEGHLICNHTSNHKDLTRLNDEEICDNLKRLEGIYKEKTGREISPYFRFPEGRYSERALKTVKKLGYTSVFWSVAYADWDDKCQPTKEFAMEKLMSQIHPGAIILLHPTSDTNANIMRDFIKKLKTEGYSFCTLDYFGK